MSVSGSSRSAASCRSPRPATTPRERARPQRVGSALTKNATSYTYDNADQMTAAGGTSYTYDANGNQLTRGADTFTWDHENRLTQSVVGGVTSSSVYYGNGVRRSHTVNGVTTNYVYDVGGSLPLVVQDGTNTLVYGLDLISSTDGGGNQTYFSYDGLGSTTDLTDGTGAVTDTYSYDIFGAVRARTGTNASPWKFTGEQEDGAAGDSGYYFLRARYLDTATGRFISKDSIELPQRFAYAEGNPVLLVDRDGREADSVGGAKDASATGPQGQPQGTLGGLSRGPRGGAPARPMLGSSDTRYYARVDPHVNERLSQRPVTMAQVDEVVARGQRYYDARHNNVKYVMRAPDGVHSIEVSINNDGTLKTVEYNRPFNPRTAMANGAPRYAQIHDVDFFGAALQGE